MNEIINNLSKELEIKPAQIQAVLDLLSEGATIPFIARYRKEKTGNLDEETIRKIQEEYAYQENLKQRKEDVIRLIDEKNLLTEDLKSKILACTKLVEVEDLYLPFKQKKKTKASKAIELGLEPLANELLNCKAPAQIEDLAEKYVNENIPTIKEALEQAGYIIAEKISENADYRKWIRAYMAKNGSIESKLKKDAEDDKKTYQMYYDFSEPIKNIRHFRILAINRGEKEKILSVNIDADQDVILNHIAADLIRPNSSAKEYLTLCIKDALKRLLLPSIKREIRSDLSQKSEEIAISTFQTNLEHLLMTRPIKHSRVLGFDPAFRTGCKLAVLDESGNLLETSVIYPTAPHNDFEKSKKELLRLIDKYNVDIIAIGNGTASRESEEFVAKVAKERKNVQYIIVSEAGASVYSASKLAIEEFPELTVEKRSAISIGRRIQDPLSELVKIDPKSIGVGEYQHDVNQKLLGSALDFTTQKIVNEVGVNVNTASKSILKYVSGLNKTVINKIYAAKEKSPFTSRKDLENLKGLSPAVYEQCAGFLRVFDSANILDHTGIHPESYELCYKMMDYLHLDLKDLKTEDFKKTLSRQNPSALAKALNSDFFTVRDMIKELIHPGIDPRDSLEMPVLKSDILTIDDLKPGMQLQGTVRNVASFGAFVDIGLHDDGLIHVSKLSKNFVKNPNDVVYVGQIVDCYVASVDKERNRVQLSLVKEKC